MKKLIKLFVVTGSFLFFPLAAQAWDMVYDPTACGHLVEELSYLEQQLTNLKSQLVQAQNIAVSTKNAVEKLDPSNYSWDSISKSINDLGNIINQTNTIAYNAKNLDSKFKTTFPGYSAPTDYGKQYEDVVNTTQNTLNASLQSLGANADTFEDESKRLQMLQSQSESAVGQTQATQAANQIALEETAQLQSLRQVLMAQTDAQTTYYAAEVQKKANSDAALDDAIAKSYKDVDGKLDANPINDDFNF